MVNLRDLLQEMIDKGASDLHITAGVPPQLRVDGEIVSTDNGNYLLDCHFSLGIEDPWELQRTLEERAGIVESGLFLGMADEILVGGEGTVRQILRK